VLDPEDASTKFGLGFDVTPTPYPCGKGYSPEFQLHRLQLHHCNIRQVAKSSIFMAAIIFLPCGFFFFFYLSFFIA